MSLTRRGYFRDGGGNAMVAGARPKAYAVIFGVISLRFRLRTLRKYIHYLKWLTWPICVCVTAFVVHVPWGQALRATLSVCLTHATI